MWIRPKYLIRFDDICPTMNWTVWNRVEEILRSNQLRPILSVIPDNQDSSLEIDPANTNFWDRVRQWQSWGWTIGLHGYQHRYTSAASGIVGIKNASEFAGVSLREQCCRLRSAAKILFDQRVEPRVWVAPGHSFDRTTVTLLGEVGISCISDGLFLTPRRDGSGMLWIPQQLWRFRWLPLGVWTICFHHNGWSQFQLDDFATAVARFRRSIVGFEETALAYRSARRAPVDGLVPKLFRYLVRRKQSRSPHLASTGVS
jgi:predicted deacetylase